MPTRKHRDPAMVPFSAPAIKRRRGAGHQKTFDYSRKLVAKGHVKIQCNKTLAYGYVYLDATTFDKPSWRWEEGGRSLGGYAGPREAVEALLAHLRARTMHIRVPTAQETSGR